MAAPLSISLNKYVQAPLEASDEWERVSKLADDLLAHLSTDEALTRISEANQPGQSSVIVQATFGEFVREMGFESETVGLFGADEFALRPDYFLKLGSSGILLELVLLVPLALRQNPTMSPRNEFAAVARRLQRFFVADNYTNVRGLCLFGY